MPAVQLARLKKQIAALQPLLAEPQRFVAQVETVLAFYSDPARRAGQSGMPAPLLSAHHAPPQVVRMLTRRVAEWVEPQPAAGLRLCDALWAVPNLECRLIAAGVLGALPLSAEADIWARLETWLAETPEVAFREQVLALGGRRLRAEAPQAYGRWLEACLHSGETPRRLLGAQALRLWLQTPGFDNLPLAFRWLRLLAADLPSALRPEFLAMLRLLAQRSPQETAFFLQEMLQRYDTPQMRSMVQRALPALPPAWRERFSPPAA